MHRLQSLDHAVYINMPLARTKNKRRACDQHVILYSNSAGEIWIINTCNMFLLVRIMNTAMNRHICEYYAVQLGWNDVIVHGKKWSKARQSCRNSQTKVRRNCNVSAEDQWKLALMFGSLMRVGVCVRACASLPQPLVTHSGLSRDLFRCSRWLQEHSEVHSRSLKSAFLTEMCLDNQLHLHRLWSAPRSPEKKRNRSAVLLFLPQTQRNSRNAQEKTAQDRK